MTDHAGPGPIPFAHHRALEIGKAAEHLVCCDLLLAGHRAFLADQGLPFDVVVEHGGRLLRLQVKSTTTLKNVNCRGRNERKCYSFHVRRRGKRGSSRLTNTDCDIVALVALDLRLVAYLPVDTVPETIQLRPPGEVISPLSGRPVWASTIDQFPFARAVSSNPRYDLDRLRKNHCPAGHEYSPANTHIAPSGSRVCVACSKESSRRAYAKLKQRKAAGP